MNIPIFTLEIDGAIIDRVTYSARKMEWRVYAPGCFPGKGSTLEKACLDFAHDESEKDEAKP